MKIQLDMYQTLAAAVLVLLLGSYLRKKINILEKFCIPAPVIGGLLFAIFTCVCYTTGIIEFSFDDTLREVCMVFFFTSVGFQANLKVLKRRKILIGIPRTCYHTDFFAEPACHRTFKGTWLKSSHRNVYRFNTYGRRSRYCRCIRSGTRGF